MIILGLAGPARSGKDSVADYLVERYGFTKFAFSSALYDEVQEAYGLEDQSLLRDAATKEIPTEQLALNKCMHDGPFIEIVLRDAADTLSWGTGTYAGNAALPQSPRFILQKWDTEYRRAQDPDYWVKKAEQWLWTTQSRYPEQRPQCFVNPTVRFENERRWIKGNDMPEFPFIGNIWHIRRDAAPQVNAHQSENPLPVLEGEREIWNNDTLAKLCEGVDWLMSGDHKVVRCEPMLPDERPEKLPGGQYYSTQPDGHKMLCNADGSRSIFDDVDE